MIGRMLLATTAALVAGIGTGMAMNSAPPSEQPFALPSLPAPQPQHQADPAGSSHQPVAPSPQSSPTAAPTPAPIVATARTWSSADCSWAQATLQEDEQRDRAAAQDSSLTATWQSYYLGLAGEWHDAAALVDVACAVFDPSLPAWGVEDGHLSDLGCTNPPVWFAAARTTHASRLAWESDAGAVAWDRRWVAAYDRLTDLWRSSCP